LVADGFAQLGAFEGRAEILKEVARYLVVRKK
jgi:hypothetical protein